MRDLIQDCIDAGVIPGPLSTYYITDRPNPRLQGVSTFPINQIVNELDEAIEYYTAVLELTANMNEGNGGNDIFGTGSSFVTGKKKKKVPIDNELIQLMEVVECELPEWSSMTPDSVPPPPPPPKGKALPPVLVGNPILAWFKPNNPNSVMSITSGSLPPGVSLNPDGKLAGAPSLPGTYEFTVTATNNLGAFSIEYNITVI